MSKFIQHLVAFLLVPCLLADPTLAAVLSQEHSNLELITKNFQISNNYFFDDQAFENRLIEVPGFWHSAHNQKPRTSILNGQAAIFGTGNYDHLPAISDQPKALWIPGAWLPWRWYVRYVAWWFEPTVTLGLGIGSSVWMIYSNLRPDPSHPWWMTFAITLGNALWVGSVAALTFKYFHWFKNRAVINSPEVRALTWGTLGAGFIVGALMALPLAVSVASLILIVCGSIPVVLLTFRHRRINHLATDRQDQQQSVLRTSLRVFATVGAVLAGAIPWLGSLASILDIKIRYLAPSDKALKAFDRFGETLTKTFEPLPANGTTQDVQAWRYTMETLVTRLKNAQTAAEAAAIGRQIEGTTKSVEPVAFDLETCLSLIRWVGDPGWLRHPSLELREQIYLAKQAILFRLEDYFEARAQVGHPLSGRERDQLYSHIVGLLAYQEPMGLQDPLYPKSLPYDETAYFNSKIQSTIRTLVFYPTIETGVLNFLRIHHPNAPAQMSHWTDEDIRGYYIGNAGNAHYLIDKLMGFVTERPRSWGLWIWQQSRLVADREAQRHHIPLPLAEVIEGLLDLPGDLIDQMQKSAAIHGIPLEILASYPFNGDDIDYNLDLASEFFVRRRRNTRLGRWVEEIRLWDNQLGIWLGDQPPTGPHLHPSILRHIRIPNRWNDLIAIFFHAKPSTGVYQLRPAQVRRYQLLRSFGIDASERSDRKDREITFHLLDPRKNAEAFAGLMEATIRDVDHLVELGRSWREASRHGDNATAAKYRAAFQAIIKEYAKETVIGVIAPQMQIGNFANLPARSELGSEQWRLALFHPLYRSKFQYLISNPAAQLPMAVAGVFDSKPAIFVDIKTTDDVKKVADYRSSRHGYLRAAANETLKQLADSNDPAQKILREEATKYVAVRHPSQQEFTFSQAAVGILSIRSAQAVTQNSIQGRRDFLSLRWVGAARRLMGHRETRGRADFALLRAG